MGLQDKAGQKEMKTDGDEDRTKLDQAGEVKIMPGRTDEAGRKRILTLATWVWQNNADCFSKI